MPNELMYPKHAKKKKRKCHGKSIMHSKESGYCYLCALLHGDYTYKPTEEHHVVFGSGQREISEQYGLKVYVCKKHHRAGPEAPHSNQEIRELLCKLAQERFETTYPRERWTSIFKKNYL